MNLTNAQKATLKTFIQSDPVLGPAATAGDYDLVANTLSAPASPDFWGWRTSVSRSDVYNEVSADGTTWNWTTYKNQGVTEQNAWTQIFMGDQANFSKANVRAGVAAIFTGSAAANNQRDHILAIARRRARLAEKVLATGTGTAVSPAVFGWEGVVQPTEIGGILS